jgi:hypothetical protein
MVGETTTDRGHGYRVLDSVLPDSPRELTWLHYQSEYFVSKIPVFPDESRLVLWGNIATVPQQYL